MKELWIINSSIAFISLLWAWKYPLKKIFKNNDVNLGFNLGFIIVSLFIIPIVISSFLSFLILTHYNINIEEYNNYPFFIPHFVILSIILLKLILSNKIYHESKNSI